MKIIGEIRKKCHKKVSKKYRDKEKVKIEWKKAYSLK